MNSKIYYIDCYNGEIKEGNIGFAKLEDDKIFIMLRGIENYIGKNCRIYLLDSMGEKTEAVNISLSNGYGQAQCPWPENMGRQDCYSLYIPLSGSRYGKSIIQEVIKAEKPVNREMPIIKQTQKNMPITPFAEELPLLTEDKWDQLCATYPQIHIFPEADTVVIKPKDIVILTGEYQNLATNSFVLHSYYNYRQLLLFRYHDLKEAAYYLGVPGIYYEREKRIAHLFGFEGFENGESRLVNEDRRQAYSGCFGYYMKQVNI